MTATKPKLIKEKKMSQIEIIGKTLYIVGVMMTVVGGIIALIAKYRW